MSASTHGSIAVCSVALLVVASLALTDPPGTRRRGPDAEQARREQARRAPASVDRHEAKLSPLRESTVDPGGVSGVDTRMCQADPSEWLAAREEFAALDTARQAHVMRGLLEGGANGVWAALLATNELSLRAEGALEPALRRLLQLALEHARTDYDVAEEAFRLLARLDPAGHLELSRSVSADPTAEVPRLAGVLVTLEFLSPADAKRIIAQLARSQATTVGGSVQREEIARGALSELVQRGDEAEVREQLLALGETPGRLWAAEVLHAEGRLLGVSGLAPSESSRLAQLLVRDLGSEVLGAERDADRLDLLAALPFSARFDSIVSGLSEDAVRDEAAESLIDLAAVDVPSSAGPELGARVLDRARGATPPVQARLLRVHQALPPRTTPAWQRAEVEERLAALQAGG